MKELIDTKSEQKSQIGKKEKKKNTFGLVFG
jgi:hypothetical protein